MTPIAALDTKHRKGRLADHGIGQVPHPAVSAGPRAPSDNERVGVRLASDLKQRLFDWADGDTNKDITAGGTLKLLYAFPG